MATYWNIDEDIELTKIALDIDNGRCTGYQAVERFKKLRNPGRCSEGISSIPPKPLTGNPLPFANSTFKN